MERFPVRALQDSDVKHPFEEKLDFYDDGLRGKVKKAS